MEYDHEGDERLLVIGADRHGRLLELVRAAGALLCSKLLLDRVRLQPVRRVARWPSRVVLVRRTTAAGGR